MSELEEQLTEEKIRLLKRYTDAELKAILKQLERQPQEPHTYKVGLKNVRYGVISDTHIGNKCYDKGLMDFAAKIFKRRKVDFVLHIGDVCDGLYTNRPGHVFELEYIGGDEQVDAAVNELGKLGNIPLFFITGNHTYNTFFKNAGIDIGKTIESKLDNATYLGNARGKIELEHGISIDLMHPDGGTAYAISYKPQKIIEAIEGGHKPNVLWIGHFHKAEYIFYRNIHAFQAGTLEGQTPYMAGKHIPAHKGFWVCTMNIGKKGIHKIVPEFYPSYD